MLTFTYRAREASGKLTTGVVQSPSQSDAIRILQGEGKTVTDIRIGAKEADSGQAPVRFAAGQVKREEVIALASQLSIMLETGVPLSEALQAFVDQSKSAHFKRVVEVVADRVVSGVQFSTALAEFPKVFPVLMISLMEASEASGTMGLMLGRISDYLGSERRTIRQIRGALTYPAIMMVLSVGVTLLLVTWVLPRFARIYEAREATLPVATRIVIQISDFFSMHWLSLIAGGISLIVLTMFIRTLGWGARIFDGVKLNMPIIGPIFTKFYLTRATRTLGTLLGSGVGLLDSVRIVRGVTQNSYWDELWVNIDSAITCGQTISEVVSESKLIPAPVAQMIDAGERSGRLPLVLEKIANSTEEDLEDAIKQGTQLIEPAMIIFMGATIGFIAIALLLPIFNVSSIMGH